MNEESVKPHPISQNSKLKTLYIVGPTASGKTAASIELALKLDAEVICADSQTLRKGMDIGTAKPSSAEMRGVPHYMLDIIDPYEDFNLSKYLERARRAIQDIHDREKLAIVVGGTGLYIDALYFNFELPALKNSELEQKEELNKLSIEELSGLLTERNLSFPHNSLNKRHLINTLLRGGSQGMSGQPEEGSLIVGINPGRETVIQRINQRVDTMFDSGFIEEVSQIVARYGRPPKEFDAIGYRIAMKYLDGYVTLNEARELFKIADRQYAKRQLSWFKRNAHIQWFETPSKAVSYILGI